MTLELKLFTILAFNYNNNNNNNKKAVLSQGEPRDAAVNFERYRIYLIFHHDSINVHKL